METGDMLAGRETTVALLPQTSMALRRIVIGMGNTHARPDPLPQSKKTLLFSPWSTLNPMTFVSGEAVPWCFSDASVSQGGELCVNSQIPTAERVDCFPEPGASAKKCVARGCYWCSSSPTDGTPWCFVPREQGYRVVGGIQTTAKGYQVQLERVNTPSWYGKEFQNVQLDIEFHTVDRLRIKVNRLVKKINQDPVRSRQIKLHFNT